MSKHTSSYTFLCSFVAALMVSVTMREVTSHLVYLHSTSIVSTDLFGLQSRALLYMTAEDIKSCNERLIKTPVSTTVQPHPITWA